MIVKLVGTALASFEKQDVSLVHDFKSGGSARGGRAGHDKEQLFRIAMEMIGRIVLVRVELPYVEVQVLRADALSFTGNIREQGNPSILPGFG